MNCSGSTVSVYGGGIRISSSCVLCLYCKWMDDAIETPWAASAVCLLGLEEARKYKRYILTYWLCLTDDNKTIDGSISQEYSFKWW